MRSDRRVLLAVLVLNSATIPVYADEMASAAFDASSRATETSPEVIAILSGALDATEYSEEARCLKMRQVRQVDILDERHLLFRSRRDAWLNRLPVRCSGLRTGQHLQFELHGSQLCQNDTLRAHDRGIGSGGDFPVHCRVGRFESVDVQQAAALVDWFGKTGRTHRPAGPPSTAEQEEMRQ